MHSRKSTIVRFNAPATVWRGAQGAMRSAAPAVTRAGLTTLGALAPQVAAGVGLTLWCRIPRQPPTERRRRRTPEGGTPFQVKHDGVQVRGATFGPDDAPTAVLMHGWGGWWQQLSAHVRPLLAAGYRVVAYDAPSHGDSPPGRHGARSTTMLEIADAYAAVAWQQGPVHLVVAHSAGSMAALWARHRGPGTHAAAYALLAPATAVEPMLDWFQRFTGIGRRAREAMVSRFQRRFGHGIEEFRLPEMLPDLLGADAPALLAVHDPADPETPAAGTADLAAAWPDGQLVLTEGVGHRRILWDPAVVARVAAFAVAHSGGPSGDRPGRPPGDGGRPG